MASRFQQLLLSTVLASVSTLSVADTTEEDGNVEINPIKVVEPSVDQERISEAMIDSEFFELGFYTGILSVEDFGTQPVYGIKASFHATEDFFLQANYGQSEVQETSYERLSGDDTSILTDKQRELSYYDVLLGYNIFPGETFVTQSTTYNSAFYLVAGAGNTKFVGDNNFTVVFGTGYRLILTDWLTWNMDYRDHIFETKLLTEKKTTHNIEFSTGLTVFF